MEKSDLGQKAFKELFPNKRKRSMSIEYSKRFRPYNANVTYTSRKIKFSFSHHWKDVSEEIQIGLAQHLLLKVFREKKRTINIELYEKFMENLAKYTQAEDKEHDPELEESFARVNQEYFNDFMEKPTLEWGKHSTTQLGTYSYHSDRIRISKIFQGLEEQWLLDYIMYHEMLHKKFGLKYGKGGSCRHHPPEFKAKEREFKILNAEKKLQTFVNKASRTKIKPKVEKQQTLLGMMRNIFR